MAGQTHEQQPTWSWDNIGTPETVEEHNHPVEDASTWVITLHLDRLEPDSCPDACKARLVVDGSTNPGGWRHMFLTTTILETRESTTVLGIPCGDGHASATYSTLIRDYGNVDVDFAEGVYEDFVLQRNGDVDFRIVDSEGNVQGEDSNRVSLSTDAGAEQRRSWVTDDADAPIFPNRGISQEIILACEGLSTWDDSFVTVFLGRQRIRFNVPKFLLVDNFEFFRATFAERRWAEGQTDSFALPDESPVDFVLLLRMLLHRKVVDFDTVTHAWYPFGPRSKPHDMRTEYPDASSIKPWVLRMAAMAERLCFSSPSRLTEVLERSLDLRPTDRLPPPVLDWVWRNTNEGSTLREFVYGRIEASLLAGDVHPDVYQPYLEEETESPMALYFFKRCHEQARASASDRHRRESTISDLKKKVRDLEETVVKMNNAYTEMHDNLVNCGPFRLRQALARPLFRELGATATYIATLAAFAIDSENEDEDNPSNQRPQSPALIEHVWEEGSGWLGCTGSCLSCWSADLGGRPDEVKRILLD